MKLVETSHFRKLRKKIKNQREKTALKKALHCILEDPTIGKKLKGEFQDLRSLRYDVEGQARRLIYKLEKERIVLFSFGPRQGIYNLNYS